MKVMGGSRGFTLLEMMIVIVIIGILAAIAMPRFDGYLQKTRRTDARAALLEIASMQERLFFERSQYSGALGDAWSNMDGTAFVSNEGFYVLTLALGADGDAGTFTATATARGAQSGDDDCATLTIDDTGLKAATARGDGNVSVCW